jgi:hypothetical protein
MIDDLGRGGGVARRRGIPHYQAGASHGLAADCGRQPRQRDPSRPGRRRPGNAQLLHRGEHQEDAARCEEAGINTWQSRGDRHILRLLNESRLEGGKLQWIAQTASELADIPRHIRDLASAGAIGIYHHGAQTDKFWRAGKIETAREMCKIVRDAGVQVGPGSHTPEVIDYVESKGGRGFLDDLCVRREPHQGGGATLARSRTTSYSGIRTAKRC